MPLSENPGAALAINPSLSLPGSASALAIPSFNSLSLSSTAVTVPTEPQPKAVVATPGVSNAPPDRLRKSGGDFNSDGWIDLLWRNGTTGENALWFMDGTTLVSSAFLTSVSDLGWRLQGASDFTGDGKADILWRDYTTGQTVIWEMNGTTLRSSHTLLPAVSDVNWQIQGTADFTGDGQSDLLWRNYVTGENALWELNGTTLKTSVWLPTVAGVNLRIQAAADFNRDGNSEILWRNYLSGENFVWSLNGPTIVSTTSLPSITDVNWQIQGAADFNKDGKTDLLWRDTKTGENLVWVMDDLTYTNKSLKLTTVSDINWQIGLQDTFVPSSTIKISDRTFSGQEGDTGTFKIQLTKAPTTAVTLTFSTGSFVVVDADGSVANGTQNTLTFTSQNWQTARVVSFVAEADNSSSDRLLGNTVGYTLSGGLTGSAVYDLGTVANTYAPDPTRFNIDLDFRNDTSGFWTPAHRAIAQKAANDWATQIASEWTNFQLDNSAIGKLDSFTSSAYSFTSKRYVDDLLIFFNPYQSSGGEEPAIGGPTYQFGGWITSPELMPRVGQIAINPSSFSAANDPTGWLLYQVVTHEIGHVLGLVGLNWLGYSLEDRSTPQTAIFKGEYAKAANGGSYVPLQSQDGANSVTGTYDYSHPANSVQSIMSYGWLYRLYVPSTVDYALLADSGYRIYGFNA